MRRLKLLVSLHDVAPVHLDRLVKAEKLFVTLGVPRVTYLMVPDFHGRYPIHEHRDFLAWCLRARRFQVQWFLHGFFHGEAVVPANEPRPRGLVTWCKATFMTAREAEFLALRGHALRDRLTQGITAFDDCFGARPEGFVAPAWLFNQELLPALKALGFSFSEDHSHVYQLQSGQHRNCPMITWATRTAIRKYGSLLVCPVLLRRWRGQPIIRIALHPADFDHPTIIDSIEQLLTAAMPPREVTLYGNDLFADNPGASE